MSQKEQRDKGMDKFLFACRLTLIGILISFMGWCFEKAGRLIIYNARGDRGLLFLPVCPIYGACIILSFVLFGTPKNIGGLIGEPLKRNSLGKRLISTPVHRFFIYFILTTLASTIAELLTGLAYRAIGITLWDYSERAFNLFGIVCLGYSLLWGFLVTLFFATLWETLYRLALRIPPSTCKILAVILASIISADFVTATIIGAYKAL
ncbi:MAG: putative ABC transporter permease [Clostridia bacterium]|nr:putative ABC transporter permease [Clostridia bacterium]